MWSDCVATQGPYSYMKQLSVLVPGAVLKFSAALVNAAMIQCW